MSVARYASWSLKQRILRGEPLPWRYTRHIRKDYIRRITLATLPGITPASFKALIALRKRLEEQTGERHVLAHIAPISHPYVCGLHVPWNIKVVPHRVNAAESNHWCQWHGDLFDNPEQLKLPL